MTQYRRDVLEFVVGPPDSVLDRPAGEAARSGLLQWSCGCEAEQQETGSYLVRPCAEHAQEFTDD